MLASVFNFRATVALFRHDGILTLRNKQGGRVNRTQCVSRSTTCDDCTERATPQRRRRRRSRRGSGRRRGKVRAKVKAKVRARVKRRSGRSQGEGGASQGEGRGEGQGEGKAKVGGRSGQSQGRQKRVWRDPPPSTVAGEDRVKAKETRRRSRRIGVEQEREVELARCK